MMGLTSQGRVSWTRLVQENCTMYGHFLWTWVGGRAYQNNVFNPFICMLCTMGITKLPPTIWNYQSGILLYIALLSVCDVAYSQRDSHFFTTAYCEHQNTLMLQAYRPVFCIALLSHHEYCERPQRWKAGFSRMFFFFYY